MKCTLLHLVTKTNFILVLTLMFIFPFRKPWYSIKISVCGMVWRKSYESCVCRSEWRLLRGFHDDTLTEQNNRSGCKPILWINHEADLCPHLIR